MCLFRETFSVEAVCLAFGARTEDDLGVTPLWGGVGRSGGGSVGEAREVMDRVTEALFNKDKAAATKCYAADAVAVAPDAGEVRGVENVVAWSWDLFDAFPDAKYESVNEYESGDTAIDEGYFVGTHTGPLKNPNGESIPATGKSVRVPACDLATVRNGVITRHRFYYDQMDFLGQLGLLEEGG
jgi:ketosteroid isomerase-like protein